MMDRYQFLTMEIKVPSDWPVQAIHEEITKLVQNAITHYSSGQRVVATVGNVSALVTEDESGTGYFFRRIQKAPDDETYQIELILPTSILMLKQNPEEYDAEKIPIPLLATNLKFHSVPAKSLQIRLGHSNIKIAVPNFKKILQSEDIKGKEKYDCVFKSRYFVHENIQLSTILRQLTLKENPVIFWAKVSDDQWKVIYLDQIPKPLWRRGS